MNLKELILRGESEVSEFKESFGDRVYKRVGRSTVRATSEEIRKMALEGKKIYWDELICEEASLEDINRGKLRWFLRKAKTERSLDIDPEISIKEALERLKLMKDGKLANAAILLFGKEPQYFFLQAETRCGRFKGVDVTEPFIDMKLVRGDLFDQVDETEKFVLRNISKAAWIEPGKIERQEKWEYPPDAMREAVINAICHRDYEDSGNVQIRIFDDRIEIWNPGLLPEPLTPEDLKRKHESKPRNRLIAQCFFLVKFIEQWGTGTNKMMDWCLRDELPEPLFEETAGSFVVTLRKEITEDFLREKGLNERQIKAVLYARSREDITNREYQEINKVSRNTASRELKALVELGIFRNIGTGKRNLRYTTR